MPGTTCRLSLPSIGPSSKRIREERRSLDRKGESDDDEYEIPKHVDWTQEVHTFSPY